MKETELFQKYAPTGNTWDEMYDKENVRLHYQNIYESLSRVT